MSEGNRGLSPVIRLFLRLFFGKNKIPKNMGEEGIRRQV